MKLKFKLVAGIIFFFLLLLGVAGASLYFNYRLKHDSEAIIRDNYETLDYCHTMQRMLDSGVTEIRIRSFEQQLLKQQANITEQGEQEATHDLSAHFSQWKSGPTDSLKGVMLRDIQRILLVNMQAIEKKNKTAAATAQVASDWIKMLCAFILLIGITFVINFPSIIVRPINRLQEGIAEIINKNFKHRVLVQGNDELAELARAFNAMAAKLQDYESGNLSQLLFEKSRAEAVVNSLQDASIGVDGKGVILFINHEAILLLGLKSNTLIGQPVQDAIKTNDLLRFVITSQSQAPFKIVVSGREQYFIKESIPIEKDKEQLGVLYTLRNITNFKEKDSAKTNFLATISHELKTPISNIKFSLDLLQNQATGPLNQEQNDLINSIRDDAFRLLKITGELLNMTQLESGAVQLAIISCKPQDIASLAINNTQGLARQKRIQLVENIPAGLPHVLADKDKTSWVLTNLLTNAIRYSPEDIAVVIGASVENGYIRFSVTDKGIGIAPEFLEKIFDRYFRVTSGKKEGSGLGLSICKDFIEAQRGNIFVESEPGKGSTFSFTLPIQP